MKAAMQELRAITGRGRSGAGPQAIDRTVGAAARSVLLRALAALESGASGVLVPPEDRRAAFTVQLGAGPPGHGSGSPGEVVRGLGVYRLAAGARIAFEGLCRPVDLCI